MKLMTVCAFLIVALLAAAPAAWADVMPFETLGYSTDAAPGTLTAVTGQPHSFQFYVFHPDPSAVVTSAQIIFQRHVYDGTWHHEFVGSVPITGIDDYRIETDWSFPPPENAFAWPVCTLMPGEYEWYVVVTVNGETNTMYDQPELTVYPPVSVNDRATFTRDPAVTVTYFNRLGEKYFQISNSLWQWPDTWEEIPAGDHAVSWTIPSDEDGSQIVFMRFADSPGGAATTWSDAICLDTTGPATVAPYPATAYKGRAATLKFGGTDLYSEYGRFTIKIRTKSDRIVKTLKCGSQWMRQFRAPIHAKRFDCTLARGTYRFTVYATDLAGNTQAKAASNRLVVK